MTREEMFFNAMINGGKVPEPTTREEELLKQLAEKLNRPVYTHLYVLTDNNIYLDKEGKNKCTKSYIENLYRTNPIYLTQNKIENGRIIINEGILASLYSPYDNSNYEIYYHDVNGGVLLEIECSVIDDINIDDINN